jgi:phosphatidylserine/phosphatidylglycerophosphate/cardiolipin synthase-like enzyme
MASKSGMTPKNQDLKDLAADQHLTKRGATKYASHDRTKTSIMHHKFLVKDQGSSQAGVLMGSTNFTPEAITVQANLLHTFKSKQLADAYGAQHDFLFDDPTKGETAKTARWIDITDVKGAAIRLFFSPEPSKTKDSKQTGKRISINEVVNAVKKAKRSVIFCLFSPTDQELLDAFFKAGDSNKMMFGLLNSIQDPSKPSGKKKLDPEKAQQKPKANYKVVTELFHRSRKDRKEVAFDYFGHEGVPAPEGFLPEFSTIDTSAYDLSANKKTSKSKTGKTAKLKPIPAVHIHHKFIVIDAETDDPTIYTGSANMSNNSTYNNDENLLEIKNSRLAKIYLAEFMRLYEHYRTRAIWNEEHGKGKDTKGKKGKKTRNADDGFRLKTTRNDWVKDAYQKNSPGWISRTHLSGATA